MIQVSRMAHSSHVLCFFFNSKIKNKGSTMPVHGATSGQGKEGIDPFTRKTSVKKILKGQKKQQGSSRFRTKGQRELVQLSLLKGYESSIF